MTVSLNRQSLAGEYSARYTGTSRRLAKRWLRETVQWPAKSGDSTAVTLIKVAQINPEVLEIIAA